MISVKISYWQLRYILNFLFIHSIYFKMKFEIFRGVPKVNKGFRSQMKFLFMTIFILK